MYRLHINMVLLKRVLFPFILPGLFDLEGLGAGAGFRCTSPSYQQVIDFMMIKICKHVPILP
jgi:hypothetical protein